MLQQIIPLILQKLGEKLKTSVAEWTAQQLLPQQMRAVRAASTQLLEQEAKLSAMRLQLDTTTATQTIDLKRQELALQQLEIQQKRLLSHLYLEETKKRTLAEIQMRDKELQARYDQGRWVSVFSRDEVKLIFGNEQSQHRLLMLVPVPDMPETLSLSFRDSLKKELRNQLKSFMEKYFPLDNDTCPVEFYGKYFERAVFDAEIKQLESILPVPTAVIYTDITDHQVYINIRLSGLDKILSFSSEAWDWEQEKQNWQTQGFDETQSLRKVRELIVKLHQVFAAFLADWYYLNINPLYEPRLLQESCIEDLPADWVKSCVEKLQPVQTAYRQAYTLELQKLTVQQQTLGNEFSFEYVVQVAGKMTRLTGKNYQKVFDLGRNIKLEMVYIPAGEFWMGSPGGEGEMDEKPQHKVKITQPFYLSKYPITQSQYEVVTGKNPSSFLGKNRPVEMISWQDAQLFCQQLSKLLKVSCQLPSEAQWEYACRAGQTTAFYYGETISEDLANYDGSQAVPAGVYREQTVDVGNFPANAFGLYDMHGNVREWCTDSWHDNYQDAPPDEQVWCEEPFDTTHILRGGSWDDYPENCRSAYRFQSESVTERENTNGLRVMFVNLFKEE